MCLHWGNNPFNLFTFQCPILIVIFCHTHTSIVVYPRTTFSLHQKRRDGDHKSHTRRSPIHTIFIWRRTSWFLEGDRKMLEPQPESSSILKWSIHLTPSSDLSIDEESKSPKSRLSTCWMGIIQHGCTITQGFWNLWFRFMFSSYIKFSFLQYWDFAFTSRFRLVLHSIWFSLLRILDHMNIC